MKPWPWLIALVTLLTITRLITVSRLNDDPFAGDVDDGRGLVFADGRDTSKDAWLDQLVKEWNNTHSASHEVRFVQLPTTTDEHRAQLVAHAQDPLLAEEDDAAKRRSECYDVVTLDLIWTHEFAASGYIVPLEESKFPTDAILDRALDSARFDGELWAVPMRTDAALLYYRTDLLRQEGLSPPTSWEQLRTQAKQLATKYGLHGYVGQFDKYEGFTAGVVEAIHGAAGDIPPDADGVELFGSDAAERGMRRIIDGFAEQWIPHKAARFREEEARQDFQDGKAVFMHNWPYAYQVMRHDQKSRVKDAFDVAPLPVPSVLGGWNLAVSECSVNRRLAYEFINFLLREKTQESMFRKAGFAPALESLYTKQELLDEFPYLSVLKRGLDAAVNRPASPSYVQVTRAIQMNLHPTLINAPGSLPSSLAALLREIDP
ncbi:extracellular solute-binding protein [Nonomuraea diastatica]|uniref:extracellular solute-binding protein n=1 Tax=Nonomuraea diastatica TaxID=1848329 RepID=UPI0014080E61|nr:extracellular solute-binding protein [Nonomuraea diastatica]